MSEFAIKKAPTSKRSGLWNKCLAVSYSHMGRPHTTIGAEHFHFRVRDEIGWYLLAIAARQNWFEAVFDTTPQ